MDMEDMRKPPSSKEEDRGSRRISFLGAVEMPVDSLICVRFVWRICGREPFDAPPHATLPVLVPAWAAMGQSACGKLPHKATHDF
jgi:hypothetical protein